MFTLQNLLRYMEFKMELFLAHYFKCRFVFGILKERFVPLACVSRKDIKNCGFVFILLRFEEVQQNFCCFLSMKLVFSLSAIQVLDKNNS